MAELKILKFKEEMMIKSFDLTDEQVSEIKGLNSQKVALQGLINEFTGSDVVLDKLLSRMTTTQEAYDQWFVTMQEKFGATVTPQNRWNVDFVNKKLELL